MSLLKVTGLNAIAVIIKILSSIVLNKILAVYVGPAGFATIGQFQNFTSLANSGSGGLIANGVVKYTAEFSNDDSRKIKLWRTAGTLTGFFSLFVCLAVAFSSSSLAVAVLGDAQYADVFGWVSLGIFFNSIATLFLSVLNGQKEVRKYVVVNISASVVNVVFVCLLAVFMGVKGALVALALNQSFIFLFALCACYKESWFSVHNFFGDIHVEHLKKLLFYALMAMTSAITVPVSQLVVRNLIGSSYGLEAAGHWEAMIRISSVYLMVITTPLSVYYLPRLAEIGCWNELKKEILSVLSVVVPIVVVCSFLIYLMREFIVLALFDKRFIPMVELFGWQMAGDTVKVCSWVFGFVLLGKAMTREFVVSEIVFSLSWIFLVDWFTSIYGVVGAQMGYFANYIVHLFVMIYLVTRRMKFNEKN